MTEQSDEARTPKLTMLIVSHTHWDREWYRPFQEFRFSLVEMIDGLLDLLARDPGYRYFMLDGQTVVLEDYLELRPERRDALARLIRSGRLLVGPWYVLPDEFLVSGESLIRNLAEGRRIAAAFGEPMPVGYIPDPFGHVAQMPQILRGFGIGSAAIWRGVGREVQTSEFWWAGLDGVPILVLHLADSYANAADLPCEPEQLRRRLERIRDSLAPLATTPYLVLMNGRDHAFPQTDLSRAIETARGLLPDVEVEHASLPLVLQRLAACDASARPTVRGELRSCERAPLLPGVASARTWIKQRNAACEARLEKWAEPFAAWAHLAAGEPDQRELLRYAWRQLLVNHAHDSICGCSVDQVHEEMSPRFDQIDQLAERVIEKSLAALALRARTAAAEPRSHPGPDVVVFNPSSWPRADVVTLRVPADLAWGVLDRDGQRLPAQVVGPEREECYELDMPPSDVLSLLERSPGGRAPVWNEDSFRLLEEWLCGLFGDRMHGGRLASVSLEPGPQHESYRAVAELHHAPRGDAAEIRETLARLAEIAGRRATRVIQLRVRRRDVEVCWRASPVPACGYAGFGLVHEPVSGTAASGDAARAFEDGLENAHLRVEVDRAEGTLTVVDRATGAVYAGLNRLVDGGDAGDEYNYCPPVRDRLVQRPRSRPTVSVLESGPTRSALRIDAVWELPSALSPDRRARSDETVACPVSTTVSLAAGARALALRVELTNPGSDHRLRAHFPTGCDAGRAFARGQFGVLERAHAVPPGDPSWAELPMGTRPHTGFVDVAAGMRGLLLISRGLPEYEVLQTRDGDEIALTLLRSVGWLSRDDLAVRLGHAGPGFPTPAAQCLGRHIFEYAVVPHQEGWPSLVREVDNYLHPLRAQLTSGHSGGIPTRHGFLSLEPEPLEVSAVKTAEDGRGLIVRFFNPLREPVAARLSIGLPVAAVERVDLSERSVETLELDGTGIALEVGAGEIVTLRLRPAHPID